MDNVHFKSDKHDWETPPEVFDPLHEEFLFAVDVCATQDNAKCGLYISEEDNLDIYGRMVDGIPNWSLMDGPAWMNPPYGREVGDWVQQAYIAKDDGMTSVCLLPARTDTKWWGIFYDHTTWRTWDPRDEIRFLKGRIKFVGAENCAPFPSAIVVLRGK